MIYLRVHPDSSNYNVFDHESELYDTHLNEVDPESLTSTDVLFRMTPAQFRPFLPYLDKGIDGMFFRVYHDKANTDITKGTVYDENYEVRAAEDVPKGGTFVVIPATEEEFETLEKLGEF